MTQTCSNTLHTVYLKRGEGYTSDDNARALITVAKHHRLKHDAESEKLAQTYLAFLNYMQKPDGNFHNYLGYTNGSS